MPKTVTGFPRACDALQTRWNISRLPRIAPPSHAVCSPSSPPAPAPCLTTAPDLIRLLFERTVFCFVVLPSASSHLLVGLPSASPHAPTSPPPGVYPYTYPNAFRLCTRNAAGNGRRTHSCATPHLTRWRARQSFRRFRWPRRPALF